MNNATISKTAFIDCHLVIISSLIISSLFSCEDFVDVDPPRTSLVAETVFTNDVTAIAAISDIYSQMIVSGFASGDNTSATFVTALSSDELMSIISGSTSVELLQFNNNEILPSNNINTSFWTNLYQYIFKANAIMEGLKDSEGVTQNVKEQLLGEALFIRGFSYFYLVNLFGDVPLALTTDFQINAALHRTPASKVYEQIFIDLEEAQNRLAADYSFSMGERVRPNRWVATALLARAYLYVGDWANAEAQATAIINNTAMYNLIKDLNGVFLANNLEAIWQLAGNRNANEARVFIFTNRPTTAMLSSQFVNSFEIGDNRVSYWIGSTKDGADTFYYPFKYKAVELTNPIREYSMVFRLAEQYLIRAEARAQQGNISGSQQDLNMIRTRAGLTVTAANDQTAILSAIDKERKVELFTEWGHRWLDLKRTNRAEQVLSPLKTLWKSTDVLYPIPEIQMVNSINTTQNQGY